MGRRLNWEADARNKRSEMQRKEDAKAHAEKELTKRLAEIRQKSLKKKSSPGQIVPRYPE